MTRARERPDLNPELVMWTLPRLILDVSLTSIMSGFLSLRIDMRRSERLSLSEAAPKVTLGRNSASALALIKHDIVRCGEGDTQDAPRDAGQVRISP